MTTMPRTRACNTATPTVRAIGLSLLAAALLCHRSAPAQSLLDMVDTLSAQGVFQFDGLARAAVIANDNAYVKVQALCGIGANNSTPTCTGNTRTLFDRL